MEFLKDALTHPFFWGFVLGMVFCVLAILSHWKTRRELKRYQRHLSDKLEIEAEHVSGMRQDVDKLKEENENLRMKINSGPIRESSQALERELEIFARAEKAMVLSAPGFAQAWESAKEAAYSEIEEEERGKSLPRRIFRKFFSSNAEPEKLLTVKDAEPEEASTETAKTGTEE